ncbi:hypothetical protein V6N11_078113 [Hibiscus sabdariffa]|uniref:Uncharacterized protein n=1 Tax=Hibiscus sabdariffa TaxID=183260 RepID=A0ABR2TFI2_9ROSI
MARWKKYEYTNENENPEKQGSKEICRKSVVGGSKRIRALGFNCELQIDGGVPFIEIKKKLKDQFLASSSSNRRRQFMDKQIMDFTSSSSSPPQDSSKDYTDLINHPQNEDIHNQGSGFSAGNNGINNKEEIIPSYDFQLIRPVSASLDAPGNNNNLTTWSLIDSKMKKYGSLDSLEPVKDIQEKDQKAVDSSSVAAIDQTIDSLEPVKDIKEKDQKAVDTSLVAAIDQTMKNHTDNLMHMLEGVAARLTQLESRTSNLEASVDDLKLSVGNNHGSTDGKMRQLENILKELRSSPAALIDDFKSFRNRSISCIASSNCYYCRIAVKFVNCTGRHDIKGYEVVTPSKLLILSYYVLGLFKLKPD